MLNFWSGRKICIFRQHFFVVVDWSGFLAAWSGSFSSNGDVSHSCCTSEIVQRPLDQKFDPENSLGWAGGAAASKNNVYYWSGSDFLPPPLLIASIVVVVSFCSF